MEQNLKAARDRISLSLAADITYAQVDHWYGSSRKDLKLTVIYPKNVGEVTVRPLIVWICGGAFRTMDRNVWMPQLTYLARKGYVIASPEYRTVNEVRFPQPLEDIKAAIRYLRAHAAQFAIDAEKVIIMGESAGGTLAALTAVTGDSPEYDVGDYLEYSSKVCACVDFYGVADFEAFGAGSETGSLDDYCCDRFIGPFRQNAAKASAVNHVKKTTPPTLILHGTKDELVDIDTQSRRFYDVLNENGVKSDLIILEGAWHGDDAFYQDEILDLVDAFIRSV